MLQAWLSAPRQLSVRDAPIPQPDAGEIVVKVRLALTCGTDLKTYRRGHAKLPFGLFGHEGAGEIVAVGEGVEHLQVGTARDMATYRALRRMLHLSARTVQPLSEPV